ncbi:MAG: hypothetical protein J6S98_03715 [Lentisphaeria bacterium]|nr:hypothetical protein [Lentisphaeria bacterium]
MKQINWLKTIIMAGMLYPGMAAVAENVQETELQHECTSWMVFSDLTKNNTNILHKNRDALATEIGVYLSEKDSPRKWIALGTAGNTNMGMNTSGLAGVMNSGEVCINHSTDNTKPGTTKMLRRILENCDTAAQAVETLKEQLAAGNYWHKNSGSIFFFLDTKEGYVCEITAKDITTQKLTSGFAVRANIWMNPGMQYFSRNTVSNYLNSAARMYIAYTGLNNMLTTKGKISLPDIFALSRHYKMPKESSEKRSVCFKHTNSTSSLEIDLQYPDVLSTAYVTIGHPRHTVYVPVPVCVEQVLPGMSDGSWSAASWKRFKELSLAAPIPEEWAKFEADFMATYKKAQEDACALLKQGKRTEAVKLLNDTASAIWKNAETLLGL